MKRLLLAAILAAFSFPALAADTVFPDDYQPRRIYGGQLILTVTTTPSVIDFGVQSKFVMICAQGTTGEHFSLRARTIAASQDYTDVADIATFRTTSFSMAPLTATGGDGCTGWFPLHTRTMQVLLTGDSATGGATLDFMVLPR